MMNYIRADFYRLGKRKGSNITLAVMLLLGWVFIIWRPGMFEGHMDREYTHTAIATLYRVGAMLFAYLTFDAVFIEDRKEYIWSTGISKVEYGVAKVSIATLYMSFVFLYSFLLYVGGWIYSRVWVSEATFDHEGINRLIAMTVLIWFGSLVFMLLAGSIAQFFKSSVVQMVIAMVLFMRIPHFFIELFFGSARIERSFLRFEVTTLFHSLSRDLFNGRMPSSLNNEYIIALLIWFVCSFICYVCILEYKDGELE